MELRGIFYEYDIRQTYKQMESNQLKCTEYEDMDEDNQHFNI